MQKHLFRALLLLSLGLTMAIGAGSNLFKEKKNQQQSGTTVTAPQVIAETGETAESIPYPTVTKPVIKANGQVLISQSDIRNMIANNRTSMIRPGFAGYYLAGRHAQMNEDWATASSYFDLVAGKDPKNEELKRRTMVVALGGGDFDLATRYARIITNNHPNDPLPQLFLTANALKNKNYKEAQKHLNAMEPGGMTNFVVPLINAWLGSENGQFDIAGLQYDAIHIYHIALIGKLLGKEDKALSFISKKADLGHLSPSLKLADSLFILGEHEKAEKMYNSIYKDENNEDLIAKRLFALNSQNPTPPFNMPETTQEGLALAFLDLARILYVQNSLDSARIFGYISTEIHPDFIEPKVFLAQIFIETDRHDFAVKILRTIPVTSSYFEESQIKIASFLEEDGQTEQAIYILNNLIEIKNSKDAKILLADMKRRAEQYDMALDTYNNIIDSYKGSVPDDKWYLFYSRGIVYEQLNQWDEAEADLEKALTYRPNDPYILNYLGYGWAVRDINLSKSLEYLEKAVIELPYDGHISDSLGWTLFKLGRYQEAIGPLEKAITYLPYDSEVNEHLGDAYWMVNRKREARFQWQRAYNHLAENNDEAKEVLRMKILKGIEDTSVIAAENKI